jgi:hypothetical protein
MFSSVTLLSGSTQGCLVYSQWSPNPFGSVLRMLGSGTGLGGGDGLGAKIATGIGFRGAGMAGCKCEGNPARKCGT